MPSLEKAGKPRPVLGRWVGVSVIYGITPIRQASLPRVPLLRKETSKCAMLSSPRCFLIPKHPREVQEDSQHVRPQEKGFKSFHDCNRLSKPCPHPMPREEMNVVAQFSLYFPQRSRLAKFQRSLSDSWRQEMESEQRE